MPELLAVLVGVFLEVRHQCATGNFRHKKSPSTNRKDLIHLIFGGGSCAIRTRDHRIKSAVLYRLS